MTPSLLLLGATALAAWPRGAGGSLAAGSGARSRAQGHAKAALLFEASLAVAREQEEVAAGQLGEGVPSSEAVAAAVDGLVASGTVLLGMGQPEAALRAFNAVLRTHEAQRLRPLPRPHALAMLGKLRTLQVMSVHARSFRSAAAAICHSHN
jgi:hypothetical protein